MVVGGAVVALPEARLVPARQPGGCARGDLLLPEAGGSRAVREALEVEGATHEVREHDRGDAGEVGDQVALGHRRLVHARPGLEQDLVEVRQAEVAAGGAPRSVAAHGRERGAGGLRGRLWYRNRCRHVQRLQQFLDPVHVRLLAADYNGV